MSAPHGSNKPRHNETHIQVSNLRTSADQEPTAPKTLSDRDKFASPRTELVRLETLRPNPRNARTHSKKQIRQIASSIQKFGFLNPVIVDEDNLVLAGHGRLEAARLGGLTHVPTVCFDHLTAAQKRAYLIADNRIAERAGWNREMLAIELGELIDLLPADGFDVSITGFETSEIDLLIADMASSNNEPAELVPSPPRKAVTQRGDLWCLGKHRLLCGDAQQAKQFARLMNGASAAAIFCDPPYNLRASSIGGRGRIRHPDFAFGSGEMNPAQFQRFLSKLLANGIRFSADGAIHFVCIDWRHIADLIAVGRKIYGDMLNLVVWNKTNAGQGSFYRSQHELIGVFRVGEHPHKNNVELGRHGRNRSKLMRASTRLAEAGWKLWQFTPRSSRPRWSPTHFSTAQHAATRCSTNARARARFFWRQTRWVGSHTGWRSNRATSMSQSAGGRRPRSKRQSWKETGAPLRR